MEKEKMQFVEQTGITIEKKGYSPVVSRILSLLLIAEPEEMTFYAIQNELKASKSATSNGINYLLDMDYVTFRTELGDRKRYFKLNILTWIEVLKSIGEEYRNYRIMLDKALQLRTQNNIEFTEQLIHIRDLYRIFEDKLPLLLMEWEKTPMVPLSNK